MKFAAIYALLLSTAVLYDTATSQEEGKVQYGADIVSFIAVVHNDDEHDGEDGSRADRGHLATFARRCCACVHVHLHVIVSLLSLIPSVIASSHVLVMHADMHCRAVLSNVARVCLDKLPLATPQCGPRKQPGSTAIQGYAHSASWRPPVLF
jgi:hypothetical protein